MTSLPRALLDTTTLSEVMKGRAPAVAQRAAEYLDAHGHFQFSIITRYEILRGLRARGASKEVERFEHLCQASDNTVHFVCFTTIRRLSLVDGFVQRCLVG